MAKNGASAPANNFKPHQAGFEIGPRKRMITGMVIMALKIANTILVVCRKEFIVIGLKVRRLNGKHLYAWLLRWFNPAPQLTDGNVDELLNRFDFLILPTTPTAAFKIGENAANPLAMYLADIFSVQANVVGVPAISIPCGSDKQGLPIGLQIMADDFEESKLLHFSNLLTHMN